MEPEDRCSHDGEIVVLNSLTHGRSCELYAFCGQDVKVGSLVHFKREVIMVDREQGLNARGEVHDAATEGLAPETVTKVLLVTDGIKGCYVCFLARHIALRPAEVGRHHLQFAQMTELYDECEVGVYQRTKSARNNGKAAFFH